MQCEWCVGTEPGGWLTFAQPSPQPAPDLVNGIKVRHMEDVGILWLGGDLLQLHLQRLTDAHSKHPDASFGSCLRRLQNIILASTICEKNGHPLNASGGGPHSILLCEDVVGGVADSVPSHCIPPQVANVTGGSLHILQGPVSAQVELSGGSVTVANHSYSCLVRCHIKRLYKVGHPLPDLLKILFSNTGWRVQDKRQVIVDIFTSCHRWIQMDLVWI